MECINVHGLGSTWKQGHLLNNLRSLDLDVATISETRISGKHDLASILMLWSIGVDNGAAVLFQKFLDLQVRANFLDPDGRVVILNMNGSKDSAFRQEEV